MLCFPVLTVEVSVHNRMHYVSSVYFFNYWSMCTCSSQIYIYQCVMSLFFFSMSAFSAQFKNSASSNS